MRTGELTHLILRHYGTTFDNTGAKYMALTQVRAATGYEDLSTADVMVMGSWPSSGNLLEGFEVKISRSDWLNEVKSPRKSLPTRKYCNKWWLVITDESFVKDGELPENWGMMVPSGGKLKVIKEAPLLTPEPLSNVFVASLMRADRREAIPIDVHKDIIKDHKRDLQATMKLEYKDLLAYVGYLNKAFGINIKLNKYDHQWTAELVGQGYGSYTPEELVPLIRAALNHDLERLDRDMKYLRRQAEQILEKSKKIVGEEEL
jgi:hypothetical protein